VFLSNSATYLKSPLLPLIYIYPLQILWSFAVHIGTPSNLLQNMAFII